VSYLRDLKESGSDFLCLHLGQDANNPYQKIEEFESDFLGNLVRVDQIDFRRLTRLVDHFQPELALTGSWNYLPYKRLHRKRSYFSVLAMDNQWHGTLKQYLGAKFSPILIRPYFDCVLVPGFRQVIFAQKLGFDIDKIHENLFPINREIFSKPPLALDRKKDFLFVGRLVPEKNIELLVEAYLKYREMVDEPWGLRVVGRGPLSDKIEGIQGVVKLGHLNGTQLVKEYRSSSCLILPSKFEPWGIVIQEATSQALPIIASNRVGSINNLVRHLKTGYIIDNLDATSLVNGMLHIHSLSPRQKLEYAQGSLQLSSQYEKLNFVENLKSISRLRNQAKGKSL
jgi:glycosyltransferase involved in cell wall biosynthesis